MRDAAFDSGSIEHWATRNAAVLDSIFDGAAFGLALLDREMRFVRVNAVLARINGLPASEHLGRSALEVLGEVPDHVVEATRHVLRAAEPVHDVEVSGPHADALGPRVFKCGYHPVSDHGEVIGLWTSVREVTAEYRAAAIEQQLSDQLVEERRVLEEVFSRAPGAMALLWGPEMRIRAFNEELLKNAPDRGRIHDRPIVEVFPEVAALTEGTAHAVLDREETVHFSELELPWGGEGSIDGNRYYSFSVVPVTGADDCAAGALVVGQDMTETVRRRLDLEHELESEHRIVSELQVSLMPDRLPEVPGMDVASGFRPAGDGHEIGGDFFDVFRLDERCSMVVIGDVCGKGAEAASLTALARYTLRAAALQEAEPCTLVARLNEAVRRQRDDLNFLTCVCAFVHAEESGALRVRACVAGHPPPLRIDGNGGVTQVGGKGALVGAWDNPRLEQEAFELRPGERLVLYTDGVTEAGAPDDELGEEGLVELLSQMAEGSSASTVASIERAVVSRTAAPPRDDIAVLVLRPMTPTPCGGAQPERRSGDRRTESSGEHRTRFSP